MCKKPPLVCLAAALVASAAPSRLVAHDFSQSESRLEIDGAAVRVHFSVDLLAWKGTDADGDQRVSYDELDSALDRVFSSLKEHYTLRMPDLPARVVAERYSIFDDHVLQIDLLYTFGDRVGRLEVTSNLDGLLSPTHQHLVTTIVNGEPWRAVLDASNRSMTIEMARVTTDRITTVMIAAVGLLLLIAYRLRQRSARQRRKEVRPNEIS